MNITKVQLSNGITCDNQWMSSRKCQNYQSCTECLAEWPYFKDYKPTCKWCANCLHGKCIPTDLDCEDIFKCNTRQMSVLNVTMCPERKCAASDCEKCQNFGGCVWTKQVIKTCKIFCYFKLLKFVYVVEFLKIKKCFSRFCDKFDGGSCL